MNLSRAIPRALLVLVFIGAAVVLQQGPALCSILFKDSLKIQERGKNETVVTIENVHPGRYYLSLGRVLSETEIFINGAPAGHDGFAIGVPLEIQRADREKRISIKRSDSSEGWRNNLYEIPILTNYGVGVLLQGWRVFNSVYLGPAMCILLLILILMQVRIFGDGNFIVAPHIVVAMCGLFYTVSFSGILDLFVSHSVGTLAQLVLRVCFSASLVYLFGSYSKQQRSVLLLHVVCGFLIVFVFIARRSWIVEFYGLGLLLFAVLTLISTLALIRRSEGSRAEILICLGLTWAVLQAVGAIALIISGPSYLSVWSPSFISILAIVDFYLIYKESFERSSEVRSAQYMSHLAAQVAHDIRSPLSALRILMSRVRLETDDERAMCALAFKRLDGIVTTILSEYKNIKVNEAKLDSIVPIVQESIKEKQIEYSNGPRLSFFCESEERNAKARFNEGDFRRVFSNLVNNAVESCGDRGFIRVRVWSMSKFVFLSISDDGVGFPTHLVDAVMRRRQSSGKKDGMGFGLSHAITAVRKWGGDLEIESTPGAGATIIIRLRSK